MQTKYQIADLNNGPYGDTFDTREEAEIALAEAIEEGKRLNRELSDDGRETGSDGMKVEDFISIVEVAE
jgi:hypothetical protein